jgi:Uma2 family endonuclease
MVSSKRKLPMAVANIEAHRWTRKEYERMAAKGFFAPEARVELIDGVVYDMAPQNSPHSSALHLGLRALQQAFPDHYVRIQSPLALGEVSAPEPDLAVVPGTIEDYYDSHPTTAVLVIEVADESLSHDRKRKAPLYARHEIPEFWLVNLKTRSLEVFRAPVEGDYQNRTVLRAGDSVSPLVRPEVSILVAELFPSPRI